MARRPRTCQLPVAYVSSLVLSLLFAVPANATVYRWGTDGATYAGLPTEVARTSAAVEADAGNADLYVRTASGRVLAQGSGEEGALGDDDVLASTQRAVEVELPTGVKAVSIGEAKDAGAAVSFTGHLFVWGSNQSGEICMGDAASSYPVPVEVPGVTTAVAVQGAARHMLVLLANGRVESCGETGLGLGKGITQAEAPTLIPGLEHVVQISAGAGTSGARTASGEVFMWGANTVGEVGDGNAKTAASPVRIQLPGPASDLSVGGNSSNGHTETLVEGIPYGWGEDEAGEVGDGSEADKQSPVLATKLMSISGIASVVASGYNTLALSRAGMVYSIGAGKDQGTLTDEASFGPLPVLSGALQVSGTRDCELALR